MDSQAVALFAKHPKDHNSGDIDGNNDYSYVFNKRKEFQLCCSSYLIVLVLWCFEPFWTFSM